ncbi:MAG: SDR family oxidoreductase [Sphingobacteriia bacterium]|nr:SDR family oxidoreductase [Sphingobacteriia bacterium]
MNLNLTGKNALVGGGSQGLGLASAIELALLGANITLVSRNEEKLKKAVTLLDTTQGQHHQYLIADNSDIDSFRKIISTYFQHNPIVHILINNTGGPAAGEIVLAPAEQFEKAFQMHIIAGQLLVQAVVQGMKKEGYGRIINIISTSVKQPINGLGVSNTIRAAVAGWAKTLANELASFGITVNNVLPGFTETERLEYVLSQNAVKKNISLENEKLLAIDSIPAKRLGKPSEFGAAVAFLASPAAAYINGINLPVDGGRLGCL